jgi:superkiller protein 3
MWSVFYDREPSSKKIASIYSKALMLYQDYPKAIEVLKKGEGSAEDIGNLGYALLKLNQPTEAMSSIERGLSYYPEHPFLLYVKAMILHSQGKFSQSEQSAKAGLDQLHKELSPKLRSQLLNQWGLALLSLEKNSEAEAAFNEATLLHRKDLILFYNLGLSQLNQRKYDLAEQNFLLALSLDGRHPQSLNSMGVIYFNRKLYPQALAYFKKSLEVAPDFLLAAENLKKTEKILELTKSQ